MAWWVDCCLTIVDVVRWNDFRRIVWRLRLVCCTRCARSCWRVCRLLWRLRRWLWLRLRVLMASLFLLMSEVVK